MEKPVIGVLPLYDEFKESYWMLPGYMKAVEEAGGIPFMLPLTADAGIVKKIAAMFDGFLFTGGHDLNPEIYGERKEEYCGTLCVERDELEIALFHEVLALNKPALGICRGLQLFNAALGGTLYQDLPAQFGTGIKHGKASASDPLPVHNVIVERDSLLHAITGAEEIQVISYHHQGIKRLSDRLLAAAKAEDGLVEAVVMPDKDFVLAVQWHPELNYRSDDHSRRLFEAFVRACCR